MRALRGLGLLLVVTGCDGDLASGTGGGGEGPLSSTGSSGATKSGATTQAAQSSTVATVSTGPVVQGDCSWSPMRDGNGNITNFSSLPWDAWVEIPQSDFAGQIKPVLDAGGYDLYKYGTDGIAGTMTNYNGMAWENVGPNGYAHGGGHEGGSDNGIYRLDRHTMKWSVAAYPTKVGVDGFTEEDAYFWGQGAHWGGGQVPASRFTYGRSATGYAMRAYLGFSGWGWYEAPPGEVGYATITSQTEYDGIVQGPIHHAFPDSPADVMQDGRPTPRHVYQGLHVDETTQTMVMASRAFWKAKLDGSGWVRYQDGGRTPFEKNSGELIWSFLDEATGKLWQGGCGSNCWESSYFFYGAAQVYDPSTNSVGTSPGLLPPNVPVDIANFGVSHMFVVKNGRKVFGVMSTGFTVAFDLDDMDGGHKLYRQPVADAYNGNTDDGNVGLPLAGTQKIWMIDTHDPSLPTWEYDFGNTTPGEPIVGVDGTNVATEVPPARKVAISQCSPVPPAAGGLVYTRMQTWNETGIIVYVPVADGNVWVLRPTPN